MTEPHTRGAVLVSAVFAAFLTIYQSRCADLIRLATNGSGILPGGEISVDLANRLASEASKTAEHVLNMCIRALDYCPPVNLEFGDYLRAIITADRDLVRDDTPRLSRGLRLRPSATAASTPGAPSLCRPGSPGRESPPLPVRSAAGSATPARLFDPGGT